MHEMAKVTNILSFQLWNELFFDQFAKQLSVGAPRKLHFSAGVQKLWNYRYIQNQQYQTQTLYDTCMTETTVIEFSSQCSYQRFNIPTTQVSLGKTSLRAAIVAPERKAREEIKWRLKKRDIAKFLSLMQKFDKKKYSALNLQLLKINIIP